MSRISASWPGVGDRLRRGSSESGQFPTDVKEVGSGPVLVKRDGLEVLHRFSGHERVIKTAFLLEGKSSHLSLGSARALAMHRFSARHCVQTVTGETHCL
jgi:hypothetical protein